jgi:hypothetical protein
VLIFSAVQFVGVFAWFSLPDLSLTVPRSYLLLKNLFWGIVSLIAGVGLIIGQGWALPFSRWGAVAFAAFQLFDFIVLRSSQFARQARTINISATLGTVALLFWLMSRPRVESFFRRKVG